MADQSYNPLDKLHLGESVARALLAQPVVVLPPPTSFVGAGIYALYYIMLLEDAVNFLLPGEWVVGVNIAGTQIFEHVAWELLVRLVPPCQGL